MAITTKIQPRQTWRNLGYAGLCLALALWGWYDYSVTIPRREAEVAEWTEADATRSELEALAKTAPLDEAQKARFKTAEATLAKYTEKPVPPAAYDRAVQMWLYIVGCGVLGVPPFLYAQWRLSRQRHRLDDDGTLHGPEGSFPSDKVTGIDLSKWMDKGLATLEVEGGGRVVLDQWKFQFTEDIVGVYAQRFEPGKWTSDAYPIGDARSRETKRALAEKEAAEEAAEAGASSGDDGDSRAV